MKSQLLEFPFVLATQGIHCPAESRMIVSWAAIFSPLMPGGCIKSSQCQWWSRFSPIGQLVWEEDGSLSKTTKLLLLDSLLQEVCIESGSDGSLALSSLGLSVCLVSHNLLYSGLKKAHLKQWNYSKKSIVWQLFFSINILNRAFDHIASYYVRGSEGCMSWCLKQLATQISCLASWRIQ